MAVQGALWHSRRSVVLCWSTTALKALLRGVAALPGCSVAALLLTAILGLRWCHVTPARGSYARVIVRASDFGDHPPPSCICYPLDGRKEIRKFQKKSKEQIGRNLEPQSMSAFGGKADVIQGVAECPL